MAKNNLLLLGSIIGWFAVITQYVLMLNVSLETTAETTIRFFSYFTILSNTLVAVYFTVMWLKKPSLLLLRLQKPGILTAVTLYISIVGLVYQLVLRSIWSPTGMQKLVDELLHSVMPLFVIVFWYLYENHKTTSWKSFPKWLIFPSLYLVYILIRGHFSNYYPYPFMDVTQLGLNQVLLNSGVLVLVFVAVAFGFVGISSLLSKKQK
ncbi:MAG TPA: Pr6Pr family membrane protein [Flavobacterium sp.]|nr:Pr6Pr family membrane protein [Flavobacterium sp.]